MRGKEDESGEPAAIGIVAPAPKKQVLAMSSGCCTKSSAKT
jgi:hypothetical protein